MEVALTMGLLALLATLIFPPSLRFFAERKFDEQSQKIVAAVVTARDQSIAGKNGSTFGVKFLPDRYVIFEGSSYAERNQEKDETTPLGDGITVNQSGTHPDEIAFTNLGETRTSTIITIEIRRGTLLRTTVFNKFGAQTTAPVIDTTNPPEDAQGTLEAYWKLDEVSGTRYDSVGGYDLIKRNTDMTSSAGKINKGVQLSASGQLRNIDGVGNANRDFTVAGWLNMSSLAENAYLIMGVRDITDSITWAILYDAPLQRFTFSIDNTAPFITAPIVPATDTWYFISASYNAATKEISMRVNNGAPNTETTTGTPPIGTGVLLGGAGSARIDEVGIWTKVLTDEEITTLYNNGAGATAPFAGTLGARKGLFSTASPAELPPVECGYLHISTTVYPTYIETSTTTGRTAWSSSTAALMRDGDGAIATNAMSTSTITQTIRFRNFKEASSTPPYSTADRVGYSIDKAAIDLYVQAGFNAQDSLVRIISPSATSTNKAVGTNLYRPKTIRYEGGTTGMWGGWNFIWDNADTDAVRANDNSFGFDFEAKLNGASSTAVIDGAKITLCEPLHIDCFDNPDCLMVNASEGPNMPYMIVGDTSIGTQAWSSPSSAMGSDDAYAAIGLSTGMISHYLKATGFHFDIPESATIKGVIAEWERNKMYYAPPPMPGMPNMMDGVPVDNSVRLVKGGIVAGDEKAKPDAWGTADTYISYGSATDTWGVTLTPADVNTSMGGPMYSQFGVALSAKKGSGTYTAPARVDSVRMTIHYQTLGGGASLYESFITYIYSLFK